MAELKIVYSDDFLAVVNKPVGLVTTRADTVQGETLQDWAENYLHFDASTLRHPDESQDLNTVDASPIPGRARNDERGDRNDEEFILRAGIVHRLDKETSGLIIIAKNIKAYAFLKQQFKQRKVEKKYLALVYGEMEDEEGKIEKPIGVSKFDAQKMAVRRGGKESVTFWKKIAVFSSLQKAKAQLKFDDYGIEFKDADFRGSGANYTSGAVSLLVLYPKTGRTHQIRVHLKSIRHAVVGDPDYSGANRYPRDKDVFGRMMLHAAEVGFAHPESGAWMNIKC